MSKTDKKKVAASPEAFFTRAAANEGIKLELALPDGSPTAHWIRIRGVDSDMFRVADNEARRKALELADVKDKAELELQFNENLLVLLASLVISWSFEMPCTKDNIVNFLREAPQIGEQINRLAARRAAFFKKGSTSSTDSPVPSLS